MSPDQVQVLRELSADELMLVAGGGTTTEPGDGDYLTTWQGPDRYYTYDSTTWAYPGDPGSGGSIGGYSGGDPSHPATPNFNLFGRTNCAVDVNAARAALDELYNNSATAKAAMDAAFANGVDIDLIKISPSLAGGVDSFDDAHTITWDPFSAVTGTNTNGSAYAEAPVMLLAHEFIHAAYPNLRDDPSEPAVMAMANTIAAELNASLGTHFDTTRNNHNGTYQNTDNINNSNFALTRPDC